MYNQVLAYKWSNHLVKYYKWINNNSCHLLTNQKIKIKIFQSKVINNIYKKIIYLFMV